MGASGRDVHLDKNLSQMAIDYRPAWFIADAVLPVVPVEKQTDRYTVWDWKDKLRIPDTKRSRGIRANIIHPNVGSDTYYAENYALAAQVPIEDIENADPNLWADKRESRSQFVQDALMLDWEKRVADLIHGTGNVGSYAAVTLEWGTDSATPLTDLWTAVYNIKGSTGYLPNRMVFGWHAWYLFKQSKQVREQLFPHGGGYPTEAQVATLFDLEQVNVGGADYSAGDEGLSGSLAAIWGDDVLVYYAPQNPAMDRPSFGYGYRWRGQNGQLPNWQVEVHPYDTREKAETVEVGYYQDEKVTDSRLGFLVTNVSVTP